MSEVESAGFAAAVAEFRDAEIEMRDGDLPPTPRWDAAEEAVTEYSIAWLCEVAQDNPEDARDAIARIEAAIIP